MKQIALSLGFLSVASTVLVACSPSQNNSTQPQTNINSKLQSVALTIGDLGNPFFVLMGRGTESEAGRIAGENVRTTIVSSSYDLNLQFNQIENFIAANTSLILLNAGDSAGIAPAVAKAKEAGITVIAVDTGAEGGVDATVTSNKLIGILFTFLTPNYLTPGNIVNILRQASINIVLATGMTFVILTGGIDLSIGSILGVSAVIGVLTSLLSGIGWFAVPAALLTGLILGLLNGALIAFLELPPFIVTLGALTALRGVAYLVANSTTVINRNLNFAWIRCAEL